ncbi:MAG: biotin synthase BioB [Desulfohalobiaceae bacterium]
MPAQQSSSTPNFPTDSPDTDLFRRARLQDLLVYADFLRERHAGNKIRTCAVVSAKSGNCSQDCAFCAQSGHNSATSPVFALLGKQDLIRRAMAAAEAGASNVSLVSSGRAPGPRELERICEAIAAIRSRADVAVCASLGTLSPEKARRLYEAGVGTYHHNLETASSHFETICSTHSHRERVDTVRAANAAGMRVCSGGIFGLGETWPQRVELAETLRELEVNSVPVNFLNPVPGTPLQNRPLLSREEALRCVALLRLTLPDRDIVICGGREATLGSFQSRVFRAGANGLMVGDYLTTKGEATDADMQMLRENSLEPL